MPTCLDLFCGAGGCSAGYALAGFDVTGVDLAPQPRYPFKFVRGDALAFLAAHGGEYDFIHASPPCQAFTRGAAQARTSAAHPDLIGPCRDLLAASGRPWAIENVELAAHRGRMRADLALCGTMFGLGVFRHRVFESSLLLLGREHKRHDGRVGDGKYQTVAGNAGGRSRKYGVSFGGVADWREAMGIGWMSGKELAQAIPPAYTLFIGRQVAERLSSDMGKEAGGW